MCIQLKKYIVIIFFILSACNSDGKINEGISSGIYYSDFSKNEFVKVTSSGIYMHIRYGTPKNLAGEYIDREFNYRISNQGEIIFPMSTGDPALEELGFNYWYWDNGRIIKKHWETGKESFFKLKQEN